MKGGFIAAQDTNCKRIRGLWKCGGRYYLQVKIAGESSPRKIALEAENLSEAKTQMEAKRTELRSGKVPSRGPKPAFTDFADQYLAVLEGAERPPKGKKTIAEERLVIERWKAYFGRQKIDQITSVQVAAYRDARLVEGLAPRTINLHLTILQNVLRKAVEDGVLDSLPGIRRFRNSETTTPVPEAEARRIYARLITSKQAKGYTAGNDGIPYQNGSGRVTDIRPQLLNPVPEGKVDALLDDDSFVLQQKLDGRRLLILSNEDGITGINRRGMECGIPESIRTAAGSIAGTFLIDGEAVGDVLHAFDLLERNGRDLRGLPYRDRLVELVDLIPAGGRSIGFVPVFFGGEKRRCFPRLQKEGAEGVVFKRLGSRYIPGRPASGGDQLKHKFVETASVVVTEVNSQRSVAVGVFDNERLISAGNVTIPPDQPVPSRGQVAEVRYLYAMPESGALYQPVYLGTREDIEPGECLRSLKYKAA